jgi:protein SCO1/2
MKKTAFVLVFLGMAGVAAVLTGIIPRPTPRASVADVNPKKLFRPRLGVAISPDIAFRDESGARVTMGDFGKDRPYILVPAYYRCPSLCNEVLNDLVKAMNMIAAYSAGKDYDVVVVSFHPEEKPELARAKKDAYVEAYERKGGEAGWHFLTGDQPQIDRLLDEIGYKVLWDDYKKEYAHAAGIVICSPEGVVARYFPGIDYRPLYLRMALAEAGRGKIAPGIMDQVLMPCFAFDASKGQYSAAVLFLVKASGALTVAVLAGAWVGMTLVRRRPPAGSPGPVREEHGSALQPPHGIQR